MQMVKRITINVTKEISIIILQHLWHQCLQFCKKNHHLEKKHTQSDQYGVEAILSRPPYSDVIMAISDKGSAASIQS